jgi:hypothetical protein
MFLTEKEIGNLTDVRRGNGVKTKEQLQVEALAQMGVPFFVSPRGLPKVARDALLGKSKVSAKPAKKWEPPAQL